MKKHLVLLLICLAGSCSLFAQGAPGAAPGDTAAINKLLSMAEKSLPTDGDKAKEMAVQAQAQASASGYKSGEAKALKIIGNTFYFRGAFVDALKYWNESLAILRQLGDDAGVARILGNIGAVYVHQEDDVKSLEYHLNSLKLAEKVGDIGLQFKELNNIAGVYFTKEATWDKSLEYLQKALAISEKIQADSSLLGSIYGNIGRIYEGKDKYQLAEQNFLKALKIMGDDGPYSAFSLNGLGNMAVKRGRVEAAENYYQRALKNAEQQNRVLTISSLLGLAQVNKLRNQHDQAFSYFNQAEKAAEDMQASLELQEIYKQMAAAYAERKQYDKTFAYQTKLIAIKDTLYNEKIRKRVGLLQFDFDLQKKQGEVDLLVKDKALKDAELNRQRTIKWAFTAGFVLVFIIAFIIFRNYRAKVRINKILDHQKEQIEHLLLNILPAEVARELQDHGHATPRYYENVSVLFTDFKSFTSIAEKMSPQDVVDELNECFVAFDEIIEKYSLEKIKTIGDSYMCAGGIPTPDPDHIFNIVRAGMAIQQYIIQKNNRRANAGLPVWDVRVGIHSGPVVAGVVGKKKYAYDIWGSTVNIASRMESNGEPGEVNISAAVYEQVRQRYACRYRGKIYAKNVGEVDMYFIEHEVEHFVPAQKPAIIERPAETEQKKVDADTLFN